MFARIVGVLAMAVVMLLPAERAMAQVQTDLLTKNAVFGANLTQAADGSASPALAARSAQGGAVSTPSRGYFLRLFGGLWTGSGDGFLLGAGLSALPFEDKRHELLGNLSYLHVEDSNGFSLDVDYHYNFRSNEHFTPYAGGGLNVAHFGCGIDVPDELEDVVGDFDCGVTDTALQLGGGLKMPVGNDRNFFVEGHFAFFSGNPLILRAGILF